MIEKESVQLYGGPLDGQDLEIPGQTIQTLRVPYERTTGAGVEELIFHHDGHLLDGRRRFSMAPMKFPITTTP